MIAASRASISATHRTLKRHGSATLRTDQFVGVAPCGEIAPGADAYLGAMKRNPE